MYVTVYTRNRAAEKAAALEAEKVAKKAAPKKRGRPRKQRTEKWFAHIADTPIQMVTQSVAKAVASR